MSKIGDGPISKREFPILSSFTHFQNSISSMLSAFPSLFFSSSSPPFPANLLAPCGLTASSHTLKSFELKTSKILSHFSSDRTPD